MKQFFMAVVALGLALSTAWAADRLRVKALLKNRAVIEVHGRQQMLKAGESIEGIKLVSADSKRALFEIDGERQTLGVGWHMGARDAQPDRTAVRVASRGGGHYYAPGRINDHQVKFLVDTGATNIAMNAYDARQIGLNYRSGQRHRVTTANGVAVAYRVMLDRVAVGHLELRNVEAAVLEGAYPAHILLGNSFLSRVDLQVDDGVLVLQSRF